MLQLHKYRRLAISIGKILLSVFLIFIVIFVIAFTKQITVFGSALHTVVAMGSPCLTKLLLLFPINPNDCAKGPQYCGCYTPLERAITLSLIKPKKMDDYINIASMLIKKGADINKTSSTGETPLFQAASFGNSFVIDFLIQHGANPNLLTNKGRTILDMAIIRGNQDAVAMLLDKHIKVKLADSEGFSPLYFALEQLLAKNEGEGGNQTIAILLVQHGANVNETYKQSFTPLHYAAQFKNPNLAALLIQKGAELNKVTNQGWTPLHFAAYEGNLATVKLFVEKGANINASTLEGLTPQALAESQGHVDVVTFFKHAR